MVTVAPVRLTPLMLTIVPAEGWADALDERQLSRQHIGRAAVGIGRESTIIGSAVEVAVGRVGAEAVEAVEDGAVGAELEDRAGAVEHAAAGLDQATIRKVTIRLISGLWQGMSR